MTGFIARRDVLKFGALVAAEAYAFSSAVSAMASVGAPTFDGQLVPPATVGMSASGLEGVRAAIQKNIEKKVIPGAVTAVARHGKLVWFEAQGIANLETNSPMRKDSLFRMMSSSKVVTTVAVLMMMEEGRLSIEDKVSKYIPSFRGQRVAINPSGNKDPAKVTFVPANRDITIRDLLTHTSGLSTFDGAGFGPGALVNILERSPNYRLADIIPKLGTFALDYQPGTKFKYSALDGFDTLLYIVELVSGIPADRFVQERIFAPLAMRNSFFTIPASEKSRKVGLYTSKDGVLKPEPPLFGAMFGDGPFTYISGAGGIISCAHDFMNFEIMLRNRGTFNGHRLLRPETIKLMTTNHTGALFADWIPGVTVGRGFGLGVSLLEDETKGAGQEVGAFGWAGAYGTDTWVDPKLDVAAVMLIQMFPAPTNVREDFSAAIRKAIVA